MHKTSGRALLIVILLLVVIPLVVLAVWRLEGHAPTIPNLPAEMVIGAVPRAIVVDIQERGRGLKTVRAEVTQAGREAVLEEVDVAGRERGAADVVAPETHVVEAR